MVKLECVECGEDVYAYEDEPLGAVIMCNNCYCKDKL